MADEAKRLLLAALADIRDNGPSSLKDGICRNAINVIEKMAPSTKTRADAIYTMSTMMVQWPNNAGRRCSGQTTPVEGNVTDYLRDIHENILWENPRRHELLNWLIKELENGCSRSAEKDS